MAILGLLRKQIVPVNSFFVNSFNILRRFSISTALRKYAQRNIFGILKTDFFFVQTLTG